jgi:predicted enzyme related to lactoylglutathione lyase
MKPTAFLGLRSAIGAVKDLSGAKAWYADVLGVAPYFDEPFYVGFNVGGFELGLMPAEPSAQPGASGFIAYWGVKNAREEFARLLKKGAKELHVPQDVGGGIVTAVVTDPFGNQLGIIENPHFPNEA